MMLADILLGRFPATSKLQAKARLVHFDSYTGRACAEKDKYYAEYFRKKKDAEYHARRRAVINEDVLPISFVFRMLDEGKL